MSKSRRILAMALSATLGLTMLAGCNNNSGNSTSTGNNSSNNNSSGTSTPTSSGDTTGGRVYWVNFKPELEATAQELAKMYKEQKGVDVKVLTAASGTYEQTLLSEMDKSEAPTLFVVGKPQDAEKWTDYALDLKDTEIANLLSTQDLNIYDKSGKLVSIPYCYESIGIVVNTNMITQAGHTMDEIKDFASLKTVVEDIHAKKTAGEIDFDAFAATDLGDANSWRVTGHLMNIDYFYEQKDNHWTETPATITGDYMGNFKNLFDLAINNSCTEPSALVSGGNDPVNQFKQKQAAFCFTGSWDYAGIKEAGINATMIPYYCGVDGEDKAGLNCGTENCWAINSKVSEADQKATMEFMKWLTTDPTASAKMVEQLGNVTYKGAAESTNAFLQAAREYEDKGCYDWNWAFNFQPSESGTRTPIQSALQAYVGDQSDANWDAVKNAVVNGWATDYAATQG